MLARNTFKPPQNFDFSKNREYTALRIAGGNRSKRIESIDSTLLMDGAVPPNDPAIGKSNTPSTVRSRPIVPKGASRNRSAFIVSSSEYRCGSTIRRQEPETTRLCRRNDSTELAQG